MDINKLKKRYFLCVFPVEEENLQHIDGVEDNFSCYECDYVICERYDYSAKAEQFCSLHGGFDNDCGADCSDYKPRNKVNGCCTHKTGSYEATGEYYGFRKEGRDMYIRKIINYDPKIQEEWKWVDAFIINSRRRKNV